MAFVHTDKGEYVALSEVTRASPEDGGYRLFTRDERQHVVGEHAWNDAIRFDIRGVIPAPSGYNVVERNGDHDGALVTHFEPVLGWAVTANGETIPVTACGMSTLGQDVYVPDGRVVQHDGWFDNIEDWEKRGTREMASEA